MRKLVFSQPKWAAVLVAMVIATLLIGGCPPANQPPTIESLIVTAEHKYLKEITIDFTTSESAYEVLQGESYEIVCAASDPDGDELAFEWVADGGDISGEGTAVTWTAPHPQSETKVTVTVTVSDGRGGVTTESVVIVVATCSCTFN